MKKKSISKSKRYNLLLDCVAPHLSPRKQISYPLNSITRNSLLNINEKLVYAELYTLFLSSDKIQLHTSELSQCLSAYKNMTKFVTSAVKKLNKLKLVAVDSVYDPKNKRRKKPIGYILVNTGILNKSISPKILKNEKLTNHRQKKITDLKTKMSSSSSVRIMEFFNKFAHRSFKVTNKTYLRPIKARLKEKYTIKDLKLVIMYKTLEWKNDSKMRKFINPSTLFRPSNFDRYLVNAKIWSKNNHKVDRILK